MENTPPPHSLGELRSSTAGAQPNNRIDQISALASEVRAMAEEIERRSCCAVERLDGSRPTNVSNEKMEDPPGSLSGIERKLHTTRDHLGAAITWLNELESLV